MKREYQYISYCAMCDYRKGTIVKSAKNYGKELELVPRENKLSFSMMFWQNSMN